MEEIRNFMGKEGFTWWMGVVEDRKDPDQLGRVRVRVFGLHTDNKEMIPTDSLPWATTIQSNNIAASYTPKEGDWVVGFWLDGPNSQVPIIMGTIAGKPKDKADTTKGFFDPSGVYPKRTNESTINRLARGRSDGTIHETRRRKLKKGVKVSKSSSTWDEPSPTFAPKYPYNFAIESESGHAFELDDTKNNERVNLAHKSGSFMEMDAKGNRVEKITKNKYTVVLGDDFVSIDGKCSITVNGNCNLKTSGDLNVEANGININAINDVRIRAGRKLMIEGKTVDIKSTKTTKVGAGGKLSMKGKSATVQGKSVTLAGKVSNKVKTKHGIGNIIPSGSASSPSSTGLKAPS